MRTKSIETGFDFEQLFYGKPCVVLEIAEECLRSVNGNCASETSELQQMCDQEKSGGCFEYHILG